MNLSLLTVGFIDGTFPKTSQYARPSSLGIMMNFPAELESTRQMLGWLDNALADISISSGDGSTLPKKIPYAAACFHQVIEHAFAIEKLFTPPSQFGSGFALLRPLFEGLIRGLWLLHCSTETQAINFIERDILKFDLENLIGRVEAQHIAFSNGQLSQIKTGAWDAMCSFAHGGSHQLARRFKGTEIVANYTDAEKIEVLKSLRLFSLFAAFEIAVLGNKGNWEEILNRMKQEVGVA